MQHSILQILQAVADIYSKSELNILSQIITERLGSVTTTGIMSDKNSQLSVSLSKKVEEIVARLKEGEPIQYIVQKTEFYGLPFKVTPDVLIPRPETEELVEWLLSESQRENCSILDIGTGSGSIAVTLAKLMPKADVHGWDISVNSLKVAKENASLNRVDVHFKECDILQPISQAELFDVIVSNPPYVMESEKAEMEDNVLAFEPHGALFVSDDDALVFYERIADVATMMLNDGGALYFEINREKGVEVCTLLQGKGFNTIELRKDISGNDRMVRAVWRGEGHGQ